MPDESRKRIPKRKKETAKDATDEQAAPQHSTAEFEEGLDQILDEIDEVLEENAEEFVKSYVQKGGQ